MKHGIFFQIFRFKIQLTQLGARGSGACFSKTKNQIHPRYLGLIKKYIFKRPFLYYVRKETIKWVDGFRIMAIFVDV